MKEVIILAGGIGSRLKSVVPELPKCLADVAGKPFLTYVLDSLISFQYTHFVFSLGYKSEFIIDFIAQNYPDLHATFAVENEPLFTGGAIRLSLESCAADNVLIINADTYFGFDLGAFMEMHVQTNADLSIALKYMQGFDRYGVVKFDANKNIESFEEKKFQEFGYINCGYIYIKRDILVDYPINFPFSFEKDFLFEHIHQLKMKAFVGEGYFIDIGIPEDFNKACADFHGIDSLHDLNTK